MNIKIYVCTGLLLITGTSYAMEQQVKRTLSVLLGHQKHNDAQRSPESPKTPRKPDSPHKVRINEKHNQVFTFKEEVVDFGESHKGAARRAMVKTLTPEEQQHIRDDYIKRLQAAFDQKAREQGIHSDQDSEQKQGYYIDMNSDDQESDDASEDHDMNTNIMQAANTN